MHVGKTKSISNVLQSLKFGTNVLFSSKLISAIGCESSSSGFKTRLFKPTSKNQCQLFLRLSLLICEGFLLMLMLSPIISLHYTWDIPVFSNSSFSLSIKHLIFSACRSSSCCLCLDAAEEETHRPILPNVSIVCK